MNTVAMFANRQFRYMRLEFCHSQRLDFLKAICYNTANAYTFSSFVDVSIEHAAWSIGKFGHAISMCALFMNIILHSIWRVGFFKATEVHLLIDNFAI